MARTSQNVGRRDQRQPTPPALDQSVDRVQQQLLVVEVVVGMRIADLGASVRDKREVTVEQVANARIERLRVREDHSVGRRRLDEIAHRLHDVGVSYQGHHDQVVIGRCEHARDAENDASLKLGDGDVLVEDQANDESASGAQAHARPMWPVADLFGDFAHARPGFGAELRSILERPRHCGQREASDLRDRLEGRRAAHSGPSPRRLAEVLLRGAFLPSPSNVCRHQPGPSPKVRALRPFLRQAHEKRNRCSSRRALLIQ